MKTDFDHAVRSVLADIIAVAPAPDEPHGGVAVVGRASHSSGKRRAVLLAAACLVVAALVAGDFMLRSRSTTPTEAASSTATRFWR